MQNIINLLCDKARRGAYWNCDDLSIEIFLSASRRFMARRGMVTDIYSVNTTDFVGPRWEIKELYEAYARQITYEIVANNLRNL